METKYWTKAITFGQAARWRDFHTAAEIDDKLYIFGGRADIFGQMQSSNDFYDNKLVVKSLDTKSRLAISLKLFWKLPKIAFGDFSVKELACFLENFTRTFIKKWVLALIIWTWRNGLGIKSVMRVKSNRKDDAHMQHSFIREKCELF